MGIEHHIHYAMATLWKVCLINGSKCFTLLHHFILLEHLDYKTHTWFYTVYFTSQCMHFLSIKQATHLISHQAGMMSVMEQGTRRARRPKPPQQEKRLLSPLASSLRAALRAGWQVFEMLRKTRISPGLKVMMSLDLV